jgi:hypothetical protein
VARARKKKVQDGSRDVSLQEFLSHRPKIQHLFDVTPDLDPAAFGPDEVGSAAVLVGKIRAQGERFTDVRLLVPDGERHLALATELAESLRSDIYLTAAGSELKYVHESSAVSGDLWEAVATDPATGEPSAWLVVRPGDLPEDMATWFVSTRGRLRPSNGLVRVSLPGGLGFPTKPTFREAAHLTSRMRASTFRLTTIAVNADQGRFEICRFDDSGTLLGGVEFATLVSASLDMIHPDVQLAFTWPRDGQACATLETELARFADALNRTVWVAQPQGAAFVLPGCGEFAAVDEVGGASSWRAYQSALNQDAEPRFTTDLDGRLVPPGDVATLTFPGVPVVSVPPGQVELLRGWYESVLPCRGLFAMDLAVMADGRLGVLTETGHPVAVGPRELRALLRTAGWSGEDDLLLLTQPPEEYRPAAVQHARTLVEVLAVDIWLPTLGSQVWAQADGTLAADGPDGGWEVIRYGRAPEPGGAHLVLPEGLSRATRPPDRPQPAAPAGGTSSIVDPTVMLPAVAAGLGLAPSRPSGHAVTWLPTEPVLNRRALDLYLWTPLSTDEDAIWALTSADLFLLAGQDPLRLADRRRNGYLLRLLAPEGSAIELLEHVKVMPPALRQRMLETGSTHLLPLPWFANLRVTARFDLDGDGGIAARRDIDPAALAIRFEGADHGVPGLPNDVVHWPEKGMRTTAPSYLILPDGPLTDRAIMHRGYVPLRRIKPNLEHDHQIIELKVRQRRVIDVPATLDSLRGLPVFGRLHDFVGLDLLLPEDALASAVVTKTWRPGPGGKPVLTKGTGETLSDTLAQSAPTGRR